MTKVTMHDVARLAGVSAATVSAVISGGTKVSELRTERVRKAMDALEYYPDQVARSLKIGKTGVIGIVIPDITIEVCIKNATVSAKKGGVPIEGCSLAV